MGFIRRLLLKVVMNAGHVRIEHLTLLCCFCFIGILVISWVAVERHADSRTIFEIRQQRREQVMQDVLKDIIAYQGQKEQIKDPLKFDNLDHRDILPKNPSLLDGDRLINNNNVVENSVDSSKVKPRLSVTEYQSKLNRSSYSNKIIEPVLGQHTVTLDVRYREKPYKLNTSSDIVTARMTKRKRIRSKNAKLDSRDKLVGGEAKVKIYSTKSEVSTDFECIKLNIKPETLVCLHDNKNDVHVSQHLRADRLWEPHLLRLYQNYLFQNPDVGVYDIGCHVGQYSLLAAVMGHQVVAVDPFLPNLRRLHQGIKLNKVEDKVIVVQNAVSDTYDTYELIVPEDNMGGVRLSEFDTDRFCNEPSCPPHAQTIYMDDLLEVTNFNTAIIKIDIEGHEHQAFRRSSKLFEAVKIHYIFMEWIKLRSYYGSEADDNKDKNLVFELIEMLTERGFVPRGSVLLDKLDVHYWYGWPDDIVWQHKDVNQL